jgi:RNA polymerase sigma-70 factor, ECF subfamily
MQRDDVLRLLRERILAFAASRMQREMAEDLAQDVLMVLHEKYGHVTKLEELFPLSLQILRFKMIAQRRKSVRRGENAPVSVDDVPLPDDGEDPESFVARREMLEQLSSALERLGERCKEMFRLKLEGRSFAEIQEAMKAASINTVYTWDSRCRRELLEQMGGSWNPKERR